MKLHKMKTEILTYDFKLNIKCEENHNIRGL